MPVKSSKLFHFRLCPTLPSPQICSSAGKGINVQVSPDIGSTSFSRCEMNLDAGSLRSFSYSPLVYGYTRVIQLRVWSSGMSRAYYSLRPVPLKPSVATSHFSPTMGGGKSGYSLSGVSLVDRFRGVGYSSFVFCIKAHD